MAPALRGLAGNVVDALLPHTEASRIGLLLHFLIAFGSMVSGGPYVLAGADRHDTREFGLLVGPTGSGRKGSAYSPVRALTERVDARWTAGQFSGLSTGEGLITAFLRRLNASDDYDVDGRFFVYEPEFSRVLSVAARENSIMSPTLRQAWDGGPICVLTRKDPLVVNDARLSLIACITAEELRRRFSETDLLNGFANRFLFALVERSKVVANLPPLTESILAEMNAVVGARVRAARARREIRRSPEADEVWEAVYAHLATQEDAGLLGAVLARADAHTLRLSLIYAMLAGAAAIEVDHIESAFAAWKYFEASARTLFGDSLGDPLADQILRAVRAAGPDGLDRTGIHAVTGRHKNATSIKYALDAISDAGLAVVFKVPTDGRSRTVVVAKEYADFVQGERVEPR